VTFSVTILGSSSALPTSTRFPSAHVLNAHERFFLIDCGEGTQIQLRKLRIKISRINCIFISHIHGDHTLGLVGLISTFSLLGRKSDLHIYAHKEFEDILNRSIDFYIDNLSFKLVFHPLGLKRELIYEDKSITVESIPLKHRVPTCGFIFREKQQFPNIKKELIEKYNISLKDILKIKNGSDLEVPDSLSIPNSELTYNASIPRSYAYCSDTVFHKQIVKYLKNIDLLYHEATFAENELNLAKQTGHSTAAQAARIAKEAGVKQLLIGHFSSRYKNINLLVDEAKLIFPNTVGVEDGQVFEIQKQVFT
jgi:ribonuclease Z